MSTTEKWIIASSSTSLITGTALNALANNALVLGADFNNVQGGGGGDGYTLCRLTMTWKFGSSPTANTGLSLWFIRSNDNGGTFEDGGTGATPLRAPDVVFPVSADTSAHVMMKDVLCPPGHWKPLLKNDATGQSLSASNTDNTLAIDQYTRQSV